MGKFQCPVCGVARDSASADCMSCGWRCTAGPDPAETPAADRSAEDIPLGASMTRGEVMWIVVRCAGVYCLVHALSALVLFASAIISYSTSTHSLQGRTWPLIGAGMPLLFYFAAGMYLLRGGQLIVSLACGEKQTSHGREEAEENEDAEKEDADDMEEALPADPPSDGSQRGR